MYVCMHGCMYACMDACMFACMYVCMYGYVCMLGVLTSRSLALGQEVPVSKSDTQVKLRGHHLHLLTPLDIQLIHLQTYDTATVTSDPLPDFVMLIGGVTVYSIAEIVKLLAIGHFQTIS